MQKYLLAPDVQMCLAGDAAIFLDLSQDEYFGLSGTQAQALRKAVIGWPDNDDVGQSDARDTVDHDELARALIARGLLTIDQSVGKRPTRISLPTGDRPLVVKSLEPRPPIRATDVLAFIHACLVAKFLLRFGSLSRTARRLQRRKSRWGARPPGGDIRQLTLVFKWIRPFVYSSSGKCLFDSLVLVEFLAKYGVFPAWVIGVRGKPFAAHAWVQDDIHLLNADPSYIGRYTPILAV
jgi:hypothetical protein